MQIVVGVTKAVSDRFGKGGIADRMIWFNGFPFLDNKEERTFGVPVSHVMNQELTVIPSAGMTLQDVGEFNSRWLFARRVFIIHMCGWLFQSISWRSQISKDSR